MKKYKLFGFSLVITILLIGCGGGSSGNDTAQTGNDTAQTGNGTAQTGNEATKIGVFLDSAVEGAKYKTSSGLEGFTNNRGEYNFKNGDTVEFFIGDVSLGKTNALELLTTDNLPFPTKVAQFLQTLDSDGLASNGITIKESLHNEPLFKKATIKGDDKSVFAQNLEIEYFSATEKNNEFINDILNNANIENRDIVSEYQANQHKEKSKVLQKISNSNKELLSHIYGSVKINNLPNLSNLHERLSSRLAYYFYINAYKNEISIKEKMAKNTYNNIEATHKDRENFAKSWFNVLGIITEIATYATDKISDENNNLKKEEKARIINAVVSSAKSEVYQFAFADNAVAADMIGIIETCIVSIDDYLPTYSIGGVVENITGKAGKYYNCIIGESYKAINNFNFIYQDSVGLQKYQYIAIAKIYLNKYYDCGEYNYACMSKAFGDNETISDQLGYIMKNNGLDWGIDPLIKQGAYIIIEDYQEKVASLTNGLKDILPSSVYFDYKYADKDAIAQRLSININPLKLENKDEGIFWINLDLENKFNRDLIIKSFTPKFVVDNNEFTVASDYYGVLEDKIYNNNLKSINPLKNIRIPISLNNNVLPDEGVLKFILTIESETTDGQIKDTVQKVLDLDLKRLWDSTKIEELDAKTIITSKTIDSAKENKKYYLPDIYLGDMKVTDINDIVWQLNPMSYKYNDIQIESDENGYFITTPNLPDNHYLEIISMSVFLNSSEHSKAPIFILSIENQNFRPVAIPQTITTQKNTQKSITLSGSDEDNDTLMYTITTNPIHGSLSGTAPNLVYTPDTDYIGSDSFTFKVNDGNDDSNIASINIEVSKKNVTNFHYRDEFNDVKQSFWHIVRMYGPSGPYWKNNVTDYNSVKINEGVITLEMDKTDDGPVMYSRPIRVNKGDIVTIKRKVYVHQANRYFTGSLAILSSDDIFSIDHNETLSSINHYDYSYKGDWDTFILNDRNDNSNFIDSIWNEWFEETLIYNSSTGESMYTINNKTVKHIGKPLNKDFIKIRIHSFGWWTGHYTKMDYIDIKVDSEN